MTTIIVTHENNELDEYDFDAEIKTISIGRRSTNDVCIPNLSVSGQHAKITITDSGSMVEDLNSTNGTYINGRLISRQLLNDGDDIVIGKTRVTFLQPQARKEKVSVGDQINHDDSLDNSLSDDFDMQSEANESIDDEMPLTLAEKAGLHRQQIASETKRQSSSTVKTAAPIADLEESEFAGDYDDDFDDSFIDDVGPGLGNPDTEFDDGLDDGDAIAVSKKAKSSKLTSSRTSAATQQDNVESAARSLKNANTGHATGAVVKAGSALTGQALEEEGELIHELDNDPDLKSGAVIEIKNGAKSGQVLPIDKPVTTLGRPGIQIAAIMKKPEGYFLMHIESENNVDRPRLNDDAIGDEPVLLSSGDSLNVAGIDVQFMLS